MSQCVLHKIDIIFIYFLKLHPQELMPQAATDIMYFLHMRIIKEIPLTWDKINFNSAWSIVNRMDFKIIYSCFFSWQFCQGYCLYERIVGVQIQHIIMKVSLIWFVSLYFSISKLPDNHRLEVNALQCLLVNLVLIRLLQLSYYSAVRRYYFGIRIPRTRLALFFATSHPKKRIQPRKRNIYYTKILAQSCRSYTLNGGISREDVLRNHWSWQKLWRNKERRK